MYMCIIRVYYIDSHFSNFFLCCLHRCACFFPISSLYTYAHTYTQWFVVLIFLIVNFCIIISTKEWISHIKIILFFFICKKKVRKRNLRPKFDLHFCVCLFISFKKKTIVYARVNINGQRWKWNYVFKLNKSLAQQAGRQAIASAECSKVENFLSVESKKKERRNKNKNTKLRGFCL